MGRWIGRLALMAAALVAANGTAFAQYVGAVTDGDWSNGSIWTTGTVPGSSNFVYIGSVYPTGSAKTATVTVSGNESAEHAILGYGSGTRGVLDLTSGTLSAGTLYLGVNGSAAAISETGGSFAVNSAAVYGNGVSNSLNFGANDTANDLTLQSGATATTSATGNLSGTVDVSSGSTLNLAPT